jgi:hypothetical protein
VQGPGLRFPQQGVVFEVMEVWPTLFAFDDFSIDFIGDDFFLCDVVHPELRVLVIVVG